MARFMDINPQLNNVNLTALSLIQQYFKTESKRPIQIFREKIKIFFTGSKKTSDETMLRILQEERFNAVPFLRDVLEIFFTQEDMSQLLFLQETILQHDDSILHTSKMAFQDFTSKYGYSTHLDIEEASKLFHRLYQACLSFISLVEEGDTSFAYEAAYKLMILFDIQAQTAEQAFEELCPKIHKLLQSSKKTHTDKLLHDLVLVRLEELPHGSLIKDLKNWQSFIFKYQAEALSYFVVAESIEQVSGKAPKTLEKAKEIKAKLVYKRSAEDPEFAELCLKYSVHESTFDHGLAYLQQGWPRKLSDEIPNITVTEKGYVWSKLPVDDKRALILGKITDCCQSIGGHSENCVMEGVSQPYNGFYILTHGKKIVGQAYVWISSAGNLSIDSIECLKNSISTPVLERILNEFAKQILEQNPSINRITLGKGGKTPQNLTYQSLRISEIIADGQSYADSKYQYCIAQRSLPISQLSHFLVNYNDEFKECIFYIYEKITDKERFTDFLADLLVRYPTFAQRLNLKTFSCLMVDDSVSHFHIEKFAQHTTSPLTDEEIILLSLEEVPLNKRKVLLKICVGNNLKFNDEQLINIFSVLTESDQYDFLRFYLSRDNVDFNFECIFPFITITAKDKFWKNEKLYNLYLNKVTKLDETITGQNILMWAYANGYDFLFTLTENKQLIRPVLERIAQDGLLHPFLHGHQNNHTTLLHWTWTFESFFIIEKFYSYEEIKKYLMMRHQTSDTPLMIYANYPKNLDLLLYILPKYFNNREDLYKVITDVDSGKRNIFYYATRCNRFSEIIEFCLAHQISKSEINQCVTYLLEDRTSAWTRLKNENIEEYIKTQALLSGVEFSEECFIQEEEKFAVNMVSFFKPRSRETTPTPSLSRPEASNPLIIRSLNDIHTYNDADFKKLVDSLIEIEEIAFSNHDLKFSRTTFNHELRQSTRRLSILISEDHLSTIYGYCLCEIEENDKIYISSLCVDPKYSGYHYGFKLLQQTMSEFSKVTHQQDFAISLNCDKSMTSYYEKVGFERVEFKAKENIEMETRYQQFITQCNQKLESLTVFPINPTL